MAKKRSLLWFEEPLDDFRGVRDDFFGSMQEVFSKPFLNLDKLIKVPDFKSRLMPIKMTGTDNELILRAEMPGFSKDEIKLKVTPDTFLISAEKKRHSIDRSEKFFRMQKGFDSFSRVVKLPEEIKTQGVKAKFENDVLEVVMPKKYTGKEKEADIE